MKRDAPVAPQRRTPLQRRERHKKSRLPEITPDTPWRLFLAVPLPDAVKAQVGEIVARGEQTDLPVRWIDPESSHITLHFLGEIEPEMAELLRMTLGAAISAHTPFELRTAEPGAFPSIRRPRILWLGLWGRTHLLEAIFNDLGDFLDDFGLEPEETEFHPHITLGRVRDTEGVKVGDLPDQVREWFDALKAEDLAGGDHAVPLPIGEVQLIRSYLEQTGPRHELLARYPLQGGE